MSLHRMGFDEVYDTSFSADLTIMEETAEFLDRIEKWRKASASDILLSGMGKICWQISIPEFIQEHVSTCRSPQGMMSAVIKEYFRDPEHAAGKKTVMVSFMPCTAKKMEANRPNSFTHGEKDTDYRYYDY